MKPLRHSSSAVARAVSRRARVRGPRSRRGGICAICLLLFACRSGSREPTTPQAAESTIVDGLGRTVSSTPAARRVVSLAPSNTEIVFRLGAEGRLVARDSHSDWPPEAAAIDSVGETYPRPSLERIVGCEPDLVLAAGLTSREVVASIERLGLRVWTARYARAMDDIHSDILAIGDLLGERARARELVEEMARAVAAVERRVARVAQRPRVFYELDATDPGRPWTAGPGTFVDAIIRLAGGENVASTQDGEYFQIGLEELVARDPEVIVIGSRGDGPSRPQAVAERPAWTTIAAVRSGRVHVLDDDIVSRPGPRVVEGLESLARLLHPEAFR